MHTLRTAQSLTVEKAQLLQPRGVTWHITKVADAHMIPRLLQGPLTSVLGGESSNPLRLRPPARLLGLASNPTRDELKVFGLIVEFLDDSVRCLCNDPLHSLGQVSHHSLTILCGVTSAAAS